MSEKDELPSKPSYIGVPAVFKLEQCCNIINKSYGGFGCYLVGSSLSKPDWRDVDIRFIMTDEEFIREFPNVAVRDGKPVAALWEHDAKWTLLVVAISDWMKAYTGLPVDFQFQPMSWANSRYGSDEHIRNAMGLTFASNQD